MISNTLYILNIFAITLAPLIAVLITIWLTNKAEKRKDKMDAFRQLMVSRTNSTNINYVNILNSIDVIFSDSQKVQKAYKDLLESYATTRDTQIWANKQKKLIEEIAKNVGYKNLKWENIVSSVYTPEWLVKQWEEEAKYKEGQFTNTELTIKKVSPTKRKKTK